MKTPLVKNQAHGWIHFSSYSLFLEVDSLHPHIIFMTARSFDIEVEEPISYPQGESIIETVERAVLVAEERIQQASLHEKNLLVQCGYFLH